MSIYKPPFYFFGKKVRSPFTLVSGIGTTTPQAAWRVVQDVPEIGIITLKSVSLDPKKGKEEPIIAYAGQGSLFNEVRLGNMGAKATAEELSKLDFPEDVAIVGSVIGSKPKEVAQVAKILAPYVDVIEINVSCPNDEEAGLPVGQNPQLVFQITRAVVEEVDIPVTVKVARRLNILAVSSEAKAAGASGIVAINTDGPEECRHDGHLILRGGRSGEMIFEMLLDVIPKAKDYLPVFPCGGIKTASHIRKCVKAGAQFTGTGIGTATLGMSTEEMGRYFNALLGDLQLGTKEADQYPYDLACMKYSKHIVLEKKIIENSSGMFLLKIRGYIGIAPGQFIFVMLPGDEGSPTKERPFSVLDMDSESFTLLINKRGCFTKKLAALNAGDNIYIRGPHGKPLQFSSEDKILLVAGGTGAAALYPFANKYANVVAILGAKTRVPYFIKFSNECRNVVVVTEEGESGNIGFVTDYLREFVKIEKPSVILNCGPEAMIRKAIEIEKDFLPPQKIFSSVEYETKCGGGLCCSCLTEQGYHSCTEGPFLNPEKLFK